MRRLGALLWTAALLGGCEQKKEVSVTETRPLASSDFVPRLNASPEERFSNAQPKRFAADLPADWKAVPATEFRLLNYRLGPSGETECWVSSSTGTVLDNANRWLMQFGAQLIDDEALAKLPTLAILGVQGVVVKAKGDYNDRMGQAPKPDQGLAGVIAEVGGEIITVKMVGKASEVYFNNQAFEKLVASLRKVE